MTTIGNYKGYPIVKCSVMEYNRAKIDPSIVYCITDADEILMMNGREVGRANLKKGSVLSFHPERAFPPEKKVEKKKEEFNFEADSKAKNEVGSLEIPEINFDTMSIDIDKILEDAMKTMEIAGIRLDVV